MLGKRRTDAGIRIRGPVVPDNAHSQWFPLAIKFDLLRVILWAISNNYP